MLYSFWENTFLFFRDDFTAVLVQSRQSDYRGNYRINRALGIGLTIFVLKFDGSQIGFWVHDDVFSEGIAFNFESFGCQTKMAILDVDKKQKRDQKKKQDEKIVSRNETYLVGTVLNSELDESLFALIIVEETGPKDSTLDFIHFTLLQTDDLNGNNWWFVIFLSLFS